VASILKYRTPGTSVQQLTGEFVDFDPLNHTDGFLIQDWDGNAYFFSENRQEKGDYSFSSETPTIVSKEVYLVQAEAFLTELRKKNLGKAVFSRIEQVTVEVGGDWISALFDLLESIYPSAFVYLFSDKRLGTWIGATPEILISTKNGQATTMSLAGTLPADGEQDWSEKEIAEQAMVTNYILETLANQGLRTSAVNGPFSHTAGPVRHLRTDIAFDLSPDQVVPLARNLHPTPAVSGLPRTKALKLIEKHEGHKRHFYTGFLGTIHPRETQLYVNLRCAQLMQNQVFLYLGGGFTADSSPNKEWEETVNKSKTLRAVLEQL
jgi:isochorismate synthase